VTTKRTSVWVILFAAILIAVPAAGQTEVKELLGRADAAFKAEDRALAERLYRQVLELDPYQSHAVYRLGQLSRNNETALDWFRKYTELEPDDAWGWVAVGDKYLRLGKAVEARRSYERAAKLAPKAEDIRERLARARLRAAPGLEPLGGYERDSDGNSTWRAGLGADMAIRGGFRLGARAWQANISDGFSSAKINTGILRLEGRPSMAVRTELSFGLSQFIIPETASWTTPVADFRFRWRSPEGSPAVDLRVQRLALGTTPLLVANRAMRDEARFSLELPLGALRARVGGRAAMIESLVEEANTRLQGDAALVLPMGWQGEFSVQYHQLGFSRASTAGYFAPRRVETLEGATYWEVGGNGRVSLALDLGAGIQRLAKQQEEIGPWKLALRGWSMLSVDLASSVQWRVEAEGYSAPFAPVGVVTAPNWRYFSVTASLLFRLL
jgi:hypothetical protein